METMKKILYFTAIVCMIMAGACTSDEPDNPSKPGNVEVNNSSVVVNADGTTSTGVVFSPIDETSFFLDFIKYKIVDSHLEIVGYDPIEISPDVRPYATVNYNGANYQTRVIAQTSFRFCKKIQSVVLPYTLAVIESASFAYTNLTSVTFPESLQSIGQAAFEDCSSLTSVTCYAQRPPVLGLWTFDAYDNAVLYVPQSAIEDYKNADGWKRFKTIKAIP